MKRTAAVISFLAAFVLLAIAISNWASDQTASKERMDSEFRDLSRHDYASLDQEIAEHHEAEQTEALEAFGGAVFLIAGFALWSRKRESRPT